LLRWQNCVVLLVGRQEEEPYLETALNEALASAPGVRYRRKTLNGFDKDEAEAYFKAQERIFPALCELGDDVRKRLWEVTEGRPIRLDLTLEVVQHQLGFDKLWREIEASSVRRARREIDRLLIEHVMSGEPDPSIRDILRYLAVARKGLNADLLQHLAGDWDMSVCQQKLDAVADRSFIKRRPQDDRLFLHEKMYDLCDEWLLQPEQAQVLSAQVVKWYDQRIRACDTNKKAEPELRDCQVDSLFYRLREDPRAGYEWFVRLIYGAIRGVEIGFDMRLRNEILAFLRSTSPIDRSLLRSTPDLSREVDCDCAARWAERYIMWGQREKAIQVAEKASMAPDSPCPPDDPCFRLARAELAMLQGEALVYVGRAEEGIALL
jgi:hypothetical protein